MIDLSNENVIHVKKNGIQFLQFRRLLEYQDILIHAYSLGADVNFRTARANGQSFTEAEYKKALEDYTNLCRTLECKMENVVKTNQTHSDCVKVAKRKIKIDEPDFNLEEYSKTDGLITTKSNLILSTTNADCILLMFFDSIKKVVANVHSGWKGTLQRISVKAVRKMVAEFGSSPKDIICCICPSIRKCHFEVEKEVEELFRVEFNDILTGKDTDIIEEKVSGIKWNIDTVAINKILLEREGLKSENIIDCGICSVCNSDLIHSYRVEKDGYGLETALIGLK